MLTNLIVGAGVAGLTLARYLAHPGHDTLVLEKSRGVGGRLATRRDGDCAFDHGAQFFLAQADPELDQLWSSAGLMKTWFTRDGLDHKSAPGGMTRLAKFLLPQGQLTLDQRLASLAAEDGGWRARGTEGQTWRARRVFLTAPLPQSLEILAQSNLPYPSELASLDYDMALVGLFELEADPALTPLDYWDRPGQDVLFIANQHSKDVSAKLALSVVMDPAWSEQHFDADDGATLALIQRRCEELCRRFSAVKIKKGALKKWRYSQPRRQASTLFAETSPGLYLLGDAFGGAGIQGAHRSAQALAQALRPLT